MTRNEALADFQRDLYEALRGIEDADDKRLTIGDTALHGRLKDGFQLTSNDEDLSDVQ